MIRYKLFFSLVLFSSFPAAAQKLTYNGFPSLNWPVLYSVEYEEGSDSFGQFKKPVFNARIRALENKTVVLPGYMVPFENGKKGDEFMLSSLPLNACFFCGVGGPETVVSVKLKKPVSYNDHPVEVRGTLRLNESDPDGAIYILENADIIGVIDD